jgi:hypothetical protein
MHLNLRLRQLVTSGKLMATGNPQSNPVLIGDDFKPITYPSYDWTMRSANRAVYFSSCFGSYNSRIQGKLGLNSVFMNDAVILNLVESYFLDISRLKFFHKMQVADRFKIGAYSTKWLMRLRPIQFSDPLDPLDDHAKKAALLVNAQFALMISSSICKFDLKKIPKEWKTDFLYSLHYRDVDPGILALIYKVSADQWPMGAK